MNQYIRDFSITKTQGFKLENGYQCSKVFEINNNIANFKICHLNICSINKNLDEFKVFLSQFDFQYDCIVLTDTFQLQDLDLEFFKLDKYNLIYNDE